MIEIGGHDIAPCAMEQALNLRECEFFLVTRVSRTGGAAECEITFTVQNSTKPGEGNIYYIVNEINEYLS